MRTTIKFLTLCVLSTLLIASCLTNSAPILEKESKAENGNSENSVVNTNEDSKILAVVNDSATVKKEKRLPNEVAQYFTNFSKGDSWKLKVDYYHCDDEPRKSYFVDVKIEDLAFEGDSSFYVVSYWPSMIICKNLDPGSFKGEQGYDRKQFGFTGQTPVSERRIKSTAGILSVIEKATNKSTYRILFDKERGEINYRVQVNLHEFRFYPSSLVDCSESQLPIIEIPFDSMLDTCNCFGSYYDTAKMRTGSLPPKIEDVQSCRDTSTLVIERKFQGDSLTISLINRGVPNWEKPKSQKRIVWDGQHKWWSKYESEMDRDFTLGHCKGKYIEATLVEETLVSKN